MTPKKKVEGKEKALKNIKADKDFNEIMKAILKVPPQKKRIKKRKGEG